MSGVSVFIWIAIGAAAGWTVSRLMIGADHDALRGTAAGMIGAVLGGLSMGLVDTPPPVTNGTASVFVAALAGSLWLTWITCVATSGRERRPTPPVRENDSTRGAIASGVERVQKMSYTTARDRLVDQLLRDAMAHDAEHYEDVGRSFASLERRLPGGSAPELARLHVAFTFWDGWIDARNRDWPTDDSIAQTEWPLLARTVAADLEGDRDVTDARVVTRFDVARLPPPQARALAVAARLRAG